MHRTTSAAVRVCLALVLVHVVLFGWQPLSPHSSSSSATTACCAAADEEPIEEQIRLHNPMVLIPAFASSQLYNWRMKDCFPFSLNLGDRCVHACSFSYSPPPPCRKILFLHLCSSSNVDCYRVWVDITKVLGAPACWAECMKLNPHDQTDPEGCKIRPGEGMTAIGELAPGKLFIEVLHMWLHLFKCMSTEALIKGILLQAMEYNKKCSFAPLALIFVVVCAQ